MAKSVVKLSDGTTVSVAGNKKPLMQSKSYNLEKYHGTAIEKAAKLGFLNAINTYEENEPKPKYTAKTITQNAKKELTGDQIFAMYRTAVTNHHEGLFFTSPTLAVKKMAKDFGNRFCEVYDVEELPLFFDELSKRWKTACQWMEKHTTLFNFDDHPKLPWVLKYRDDLFRWYHGVKNANTSVTKHSQKTPLQTAKNPVQPAPAAKKQEKNSPGYTYIGGMKYDHIGQVNPTMEERWVEMIQLDCTEIEINQTIEILKKHTVDFEASEARVKALLAESKND